MKYLAQIAITTLLLIALAESASAHNVRKPATIAQAPVAPIVLDVPVDPNVAAWAEAEARRYSASMGWPDYCASYSPVALVVQNADEVIGFDVDGYAEYISVNTPFCDWFVIDDDILFDPAKVCGVWIHERLHMARQDGWHATDQNSPLYTWSVPYEPCVNEFGPRSVFVSEPYALTAWQARNAVRKHLKSKTGYRWFVRYAEPMLSDRSGKFVTEWDVKARRHVHNRWIIRWYMVTRSTQYGPLVVVPR